MNFWYNAFERRRLNALLRIPYHIRTSAFHSPNGRARSNNGFRGIFRHSILPNLALEPVILVKILTKVKLVENSPELIWF